jgi:hypothetical protein
MLIIGYSKTAAVASRPRVLGAPENAGYGGTASLGLTGNGIGAQPIVVAIMIQNGGTVASPPGGFDLLQGSTHPDVGDLFVYAWNGTGARPVGTLGFTLGSTTNWAAMALETEGSGIGVHGLATHTGSATTRMGPTLVSTTANGLVLDFWACSTAVTWAFDNPKAPDPGLPASEGQWFVERTNAGRIYAQARSGPATGGSSIPPSSGSHNVYARMVCASVEVLAA